MRITDMITQENLLDILSTSPHYFCGKWIGQQMRIQILILGFKRLKMFLGRQRNIDQKVVVSHSWYSLFALVVVLGGADVVVDSVVAMK